LDANRTQLHTAELAVFYFLSIAAANLILSMWTVSRPPSITWQIWPGCALHRRQIKAIGLVGNRLGIFTTVCSMVEPAGVCLSVNTPRPVCFGGCFPADSNLYQAHRVLSSGAFVDKIAHAERADLAWGQHIRRVGLQWVQVDSPESRPARTQQQTFGKGARRIPSARLREVPVAQATVLRRTRV